MRTAEDFAALLHALGFRRVAEVKKRRRTAAFCWRGYDVEAALDEVDRAGRFVELELAADNEGLDTAREALFALGHELGLTKTERRSYLELLLESIV
jgi:adenylate cyclase, class 2